VSATPPERPSAITSFAIPDFVMVGVSLADRVLLFVSTELTEQELRIVSATAERAVEIDGHWFRIDVPRVHYLITATMKQYHVVETDTYREALEVLLAAWWEPKRAVRGVEGRS
jgi:hypothetical protein